MGDFQLGDLRELRVLCLGRSRNSSMGAVSTARSEKAMDIGEGKAPGTGNGVLAEEWEKSSQKKKEKKMISHPRGGESLRGGPERRAKIRSNKDEQTIPC